MNLLADIKAVNLQISHIEKYIASNKKEIEISNYKIKQAKDTKNPEFTSIEERQKVNINDSEESIKENEKDILVLQEKITNIETNIENVTTGEMKVSSDNMTELAKTMLTKRFSEKFVNDHYDKEAEKDEKTSSKKKS